MRNSTYLARIWTKGVVTGICCIVIPYNARYWSQQIRSLTWFNSRELARIYGKDGTKAMSANERTFVHAEYLGDEQLKDYTDWRIEDLELDHGPRTEWPVYNNIWDFYEYIKYDHKRKRYYERS